MLTPDFLGREEEALVTVLGAHPHVFNHNIETVRRIQPRVRIKGDYDRALWLLRRAREVWDERWPERGPLMVKSGIVAGMGETDDEIVETLADLRAHGVDVVTIGQYLQPTERHLPLDRWVPLDSFRRFREAGEQMGFGSVFAGPLVRSSYRAEEQQLAATRRPARRRAVIAAPAALPPYHAQVAPLSPAQRKAMTPSVWRPGCPVALSELRRVTITYVGFDGRAHRGALVVNRSVAAPVARVFGELYAARFAIRRMVPIEAYGGDDFRSIEADNTSAFNCRNATGGSTLVGARLRPRDRPRPAREPVRLGRPHEPPRLAPLPRSRARGRTPGRDHRRRRGHARVRAHRLGLGRPLERHPRLPAPLGQRPLRLGRVRAASPGCRARSRAGRAPCRAPTPRRRGRARPRAASGRSRSRRARSRSRGRSR